jgi:hypothetical protein
MSAGRYLKVTNGGRIEFYELLANGSAKLAIKAPDSLAGDVVWTLPAADAAGFFYSNGSGTVSLAPGSATLDTAYDGGRSVTVDAGAVSLDRPTGGEVLEIVSSTSGNPFIGIYAGTTQVTLSAVHDGVGQIGTATNNNLELHANNAVRFTVKPSGDCEATGNVKGATVTSTGVVTAGSVSSSGAVGCTAVNASGNVGCVDVDATGDVGGVTGTFSGDITASGGFRQLQTGWYYDNVGGGGDLSATIMNYINGSGFFRLYMPRAGSVTALGMYTTETCSVGNALVQVYKNGSSLTTSISFTSSDGLLFKVATYAKDTYTFTAGDYLDIRISSNAWAPTTADFRAYLEIET